MRKEILFMSLAATICVAGINKMDLIKYPLNNDKVSESRGGTLPDSEAIQDGIGTLLLNSKTYSNSNNFRNNDFNKLLLKYKKNLEENPSKSLNQMINDNMVTINNDVINKINDNSLVTVISNINGTPCDDGNSLTQGETWINNTCQGGVILDGTPCDDGNSLTVNDKYKNGSCIGVLLNGGTCDDGNPQTINDKYVFGVCKGTNVEGQPCDNGVGSAIYDVYRNGICVDENPAGVSCDDGNPLTMHDTIQSDGSCAGYGFTGMPCDDGNPQTTNDKWTASHICEGTPIVIIPNGTTCNDNNIQTINDVYTNGVCAGTNVQGQSCNDNDPCTINDVYSNGTCQGSITNMQIGAPGYDTWAANCLGNNAGNFFQF